MIPKLSALNIRDVGQNEIKVKLISTYFDVKMFPLSTTGNPNDPCIITKEIDFNLS